MTIPSQRTRALDLPMVDDAMSGAMLQDVLQLIAVLAELARDGGTR